MHGMCTALQLIVGTVKWDPCVAPIGQDNTHLSYSLFNFGPSGKRCRSIRWYMTLILHAYVNSQHATYVMLILDITIPLFYFYNQPFVKLHYNLKYLYYTECTYFVCVCLCPDWLWSQNFLKIQYTHDNCKELWKEDLFHTLVQKSDCDNSRLFSMIALQKRTT